uniref:F-box domain-containing protein n=1 Tax=Stomoxys calcitrans TaxID=35570 RepID=A0A1I8NN89_STOCA
MQALKRILQNVDILIHIFRMLDIDDQIRLSKVCQAFRNIFELYIFTKEDYSSLTVNANRDYYVVNNESECNRLVLKRKELNEFLDYHRFRVQSFTERNGSILDIRSFCNLTQLHYSFMTITWEHLKAFAKFPNIATQLEELVVDCCSDESWGSLMIGNTWKVDWLMPMKNLHRLKVIKENWTRLSYHNFQKIITNLQLEDLDLRCIVQPGRKGRQQYPIPNSPLRELNIGINFGSKADLTPYLTMLEHLVTLTLTVDGIVSQKMLNDIATACVNLEGLHFQTSSFEEIMTFVIPAKVTAASLYRCYGLSPENFQQILSVAHLVKLSITETKVNVVENQGLSPSIEYLDIYDDQWNSNLILAFGGSEHLKYLHWHACDFDRHVAAHEAALRRCSSLEVLDLKEGHLSLDTLSHLQCLTKLTLPPSMPTLSWSLIVGVLKNPNLKEFVLNKYCKARDLEIDDAEIPKWGFPLALNTIRITLDIFCMALDFWFDVFNQNPHLQLGVYNFRGDPEYMRVIINHEKFPKSLRTLDICHFVIKCRDLRQSVEATMAKLKQDIEHFKYENDEYMFRIIFDRNLGLTQ